MAIKDLENYFSLNITDDDLFAYIMINEGEEEVRLIDIQKFLLKENVITGIQILNVKNFLKKGLYGEEFLIAKGYEPEESTPASLEYLVSDKVEQNLEEDEHGHIDFRDIQIVNMIEKGTPLIRKHPMILGKNGLNVFNVEIPAEPAEDIDLPMGENTVVSSEDEYLCISACDGYIVKTNDGKVHVNPTLKVKQDIDFSTGNIDFKGTVIVPGDLKSGFKIKASEDVIIHGAVENAEIESQGNVMVKGGFIGLNEGLIFAKQDVRLSHVENQKVYTEGNLYIKSELLNARVEAGNSILMEKGKIIGGRASAGSKIDVFDVGTKEGTYTEVVVGTNTFIIDKMKKVEQAINDLEKREAHIKERIYELATKKVNGKEFTPEMAEELEKIKKEKNDIPGMIEQKRSEISLIKGDLDSLLDAKLTIRGVLYSNVKVTIGERNLLTKEDYRKCTLYLEDDQIRVQK